MVKTDNKFGKNLKKARKALGLTQAQFAAPIGITNGYVSDIEKGKIAKPSEPVVQAIEKHYRINRYFLLTGEGEMFTEGEAWARSEAAHEPKAGIDVTLLVEILTEVEDELEKRDLNLPLEKKARLAALLYDYHSRTMEKVTRDKVLDYLELMI